MSPEPYRLEKVRIHRARNPLIQYARNVYSQSGEDGIIEAIFSLISPKTRRCVEFGAWDGRHLSNCANLIEHHGWGGVLIEGDRQKFESLRANYTHHQQVICVHRFVDWTGPNTLDETLRHAGCPSEFDLLSVDIDGMDYFVWESLVDHRPRLVVIEFNPTVPNDVVFVQAKDSRVNQGCSLLALVMLAKAKGYELVASTGFNAFFVSRDDYSKLNLVSNSIFDIHTPMVDGRIFHGYDSTVHIVGMDRLVWAGVSVSSEDFQVLPRSARVFKGALSAEDSE